jgi:predicted nucleic acid-binding protein
LRVSDVWVVNASPLIALARIQCLPLLADLSGAILIPERVLAEVEAGLSKDPAAAEILAWSAPFVTPGVPVGDSVAGWDLGAGEAQVITLCLPDPSWQAVLDDGEARRCALTLGVPMIGTLGILLRAKRLGLVSVVRPLTDRLVLSGYYLERGLIDRVLARAGE